ncbi:MAG: hypothetical protein D6813_15465 [Calditrichaeota bacterium]|nr:MAG: hypothetical protein D6813_15465 [Calditrichota bacterium]
MITYFTNRSWVVISLLLVGSPAYLMACPVCFGRVEGPINAAIAGAIFLLLGTTGLALSGIVFFFIRMYRFHSQDYRKSKIAVNEDGKIVLNRHEELKNYQCN